MRTFLPQSSCFPDRGGYRPTFRWFREENFRVVPGNQVYPNQKAAREAADDYLAKGLNRERVEVIETEPQPLDIGIDEWRERKARESEEERRAVFGESKTGVRYLRGGRTFVVEERRKVRA